MQFKRLFGVLSLIFTAGTAVLLFFIILGGIKDHGVLAKFYYLRADTSSVVESKLPYEITQWGLWNVCGYKGSDASHPGQNEGCGSKHPAFGFDVKDNLEASSAPKQFEKHHKTLYYMSRMLFPFYLIGLFFVVLNLGVGLLLVCWPTTLLSVIGLVYNFLSFLFVGAAAALVTALAVKARNYFKDAGSKSTKLGVKFLAFSWAAVAIIILQFAFFALTKPTKSDKYGGRNQALASGGYAYNSKANKESKEPKAKKDKSNGKFSWRRNKAETSAAKQEPVVDDAADRSSYVRV